MKSQIAKLVPLLARGIVPTATVTSGLLSPLAVSAPGDLDSAFGNMGRIGPILNGPAWSLESQNDGTILLGGGDAYTWYYYYYTYITNFVSQLTDTGASDPAFNAVSLDKTQVFDAVRQPDGQVVAVGRSVASTPTDSQLVVFRLQPDGTLDPAFGSGGLFALATAQAHRKIGTSVLLDTDGRIVVAGSADNRLIVLRLLPDGSVDDAFGTSGIFLGPETHDFGLDSSHARTRIVRAGADGYRVTASNSAGCQVVGLTANGALDEAFGVLGIATLDSPSGPSAYCNSMAATTDDRLLLAGGTGTEGFAARLFADGQQDAGFSTDAVSSAMSDATAVAAGEEGTAVVAGRGVSGGSIMRLQASGQLDALFGDAGSTLIDLDSSDYASPVPQDLHVRADGSVLAAGGEWQSRKAFVVRLLGAAGGDAPGVLGISDQSTTRTDEGQGAAIVNVRRTGGAFGTVSIAYEAVSNDFVWNPATAGLDYVAVSGRLTWDDGDREDRQVLIPILTDGLVELDEQFSLVLDDVQGGAAFGTRSARVQIAADGAPYGQFQMLEPGRNVREISSAEIAVGVSRDFYLTGAVSVTVTPIAGTATAGSDFGPSATTLSWADGESGAKFASIEIIDDKLEESDETFTVELSNPTGGAVIGARSSTTIRILANDQQPRRGPRGGSGAAGYMSLLVLGMIALFRFVRTVIRRQEIDSE